MFEWKRQETTLSDMFYFYIGLRIRAPEAWLKEKQRDKKTKQALHEPARNDSKEVPKKRRNEVRRRTKKGKERA
jgi:hypothetical protein